MKDDFFKTVEEFKETQPDRKLIACALKELRPTKNDWFASFISVVFIILFSIWIGFSIDTVSTLSAICDKVINVQLAVFGCIFAVYSILLAFLSDGYMKRLSRIQVAGKMSMLKKSIMYYESVLFLYFINIAVTGLVILLTECISPNASLTNVLLWDNVLATIAIFIYFVFTFRVFYEIKSTIYNTIVLFRASIAYRFLDFSVEDDKKDRDEDK